MLLPALAQAQPAQPTETFTVDTTAIMVDVIARDRRGEPVTDLTADDFELYEDEIPHDITSFRKVSRGLGFSILRPVAGSNPEAHAPEALEPEPGSGVLALIFDRLSPDARLRAYKAAVSHLEEGRLPADRIGVFAIDLTLRTLQPYTSDPVLIRAALESAATQGTSQFAPSGARVRDLMEQRGQLERVGDSGVAAISSAGPGSTAASQAGGAIGSAAAESLALQMEVQMLQTFEHLERDQQGYATTNGLLAVVNSLRLLPGRKTIVFFAEGIAIPPAVEHHYRAVIDLANRSNVAVYTMDATGLRIDSTTEETRREMMAAARERMRQIDSGRPLTGSAMTRALERNEDLLRSDAHAALAVLADETGGFLISNTNDLRAGFRRIDEDMRFHYLLTYVPANQEFDGKYREIGVRVKRPGVNLRARRGYYAVRQLGPAPVLAHEAPAVALLDGPTLPNAFPVHAAGFIFPQPLRPGLSPILVELQTDALWFQTDEATDTYVADFVVVARLKDEHDQVIRKMSQRYELSGPADQIDLARMGEVLFYREPELDPGVYTLEAIVYDAIAGEASARISTLEVPASAENELQASSLMIVKRSEEVPPEERDPGNPLYYGSLVLYPNMGEPLRKAVDRELSFYVDIHPAARGGSLQATIELRQSGRSLGSVPADLPATDTDGRIQHVGRLPLDPFPPGTYELRIGVTDGRTTVSRSAFFTVTE